jgi:cation diffusion facilitator family transporter
MNAGWAWVLIVQGRKRRSPALIADGKHLMTDVFTSVGVLIGVAAASLTGWAVLDPVVAALVAVNILWTGWGLMSVSIGGLMDRAAPADVIASIKKVISENGCGAIEAHDVRTRHAGHITLSTFTW